MIYLGQFNSREDVAHQFDVELDADVNILYADYEQEGYEGTAFVLFKQNGKLYEVNGSHCSCYGLEGQWKPELTTVKALLFRKLFDRDYRLAEVLKAEDEK